MPDAVPLPDFQILGHKIPECPEAPGSYSDGSTGFPLVTPGLLPVLAQAFPAKALINVDLPTFGIPTTIARTGRFKIPRFRSRSIFALHASLHHAIDLL